MELRFFLVPEGLLARNRSSALPEWAGVIPLPLKGIKLVISELGGHDNEPVDGEVVVELLFPEYVSLAVRLPEYPFPDREFVCGSRAVKLPSRDALSGFPRPPMLLPDDSVVTELGFRPFLVSFPFVVAVVVEEGEMHFRLRNSSLNSLSSVGGAFSLLSASNTIFLDVGVKSLGYFFAHNRIKSSILRQTRIFVKMSCR